MATTYATPGGPQPLPSPKSPPSPGSPQTEQSLGAPDTWASAGCCNFREVTGKARLGGILFFILKNPFGQPFGALINNKNSCTNQVSTSVAQCGGSGSRSAD